MNERQYNSKLISDKLSEIPVPANDLLWSKIEAQLLVAQPGAKQTPDDTLLQQPVVAKTGIIKAAVILLSSAIIIVFAIWLIGKLNHPKKSVPSRQIPQIQKTDSLRTAVSPDTGLQPKKRLLPAVIPVNRQDSGNEIRDTETVYQPLLPLEEPILSPLTDSVQINAPGTIQISPDTAKLKAPVPQKKDEDYYFDMQKKKKGNKDK
jgi:hypothetical protein